MADEEQQDGPAQAPKSASQQKASRKQGASKKSSKSKGKNATAPTKERRGPQRRPYPLVTLGRALAVPQKIKELNGGNAWASSEVAKAVELGARSSNFYYLTAASRDFGLTIGSRETERIELAPLGREIVYAPDAETERKKKIEAFLKVEIFKKVLDHYKGSSLPEMKYLGNTLESEFGLAPESHEEFSQLFRRNCEELGITAGGVDQLESLGATPLRGPATVIVGEPKSGTAS